jgi:hypothetical protein
MALINTRLHEILPREGVLYLEQNFGWDEHYVNATFCPVFHDLLNCIEPADKRGKLSLCHEDVWGVEV